MRILEQLKELQTGHGFKPQGGLSSKEVAYRYYNMQPPLRGAENVTNFCAHDLGVIFNLVTSSPQGKESWVIAEPACLELQNDPDVKICSQAVLLDKAGMEKNRMLGIWKKS